MIRVASIDIQDVADDSPAAVKWIKPVFGEHRWIADVRVEFGDVEHAKANCLPLIHLDTIDTGGPCGIEVLSGAAMAAVNDAAGERPVKSAHILISVPWIKRKSRFRKAGR